MAEERPPRGRCVAIVGAESTGKTQLAQALADALRARTGQRVAWVPEHLRAWCASEGRTPRADEQASIAAAQEAAIEAAAHEHAVVVCDTTPLMTAVYSRLLFADDGLDAAALAFQQRCSLTLVTALDLPWQADGLQRDGPHVRVPVDNLLRQLLLNHGLAWSAVSGSGPTRLQQALDAAVPLLARSAPSGNGLFTRLQAREALAAAQPWSCQLCDDPDCEHRSRQQAVRG